MVIRIAKTVLSACLGEQSSASGHGACRNSYGPPWRHPGTAARMRALSVMRPACPASGGWPRGTRVVTCPSSTRRTTRTVKITRKRRRDHAQPWSARPQPGKTCGRPVYGHGASSTRPAPARRRRRGVSRQQLPGPVQRGNRNCARRNSLLNDRADLGHAHQGSQRKAQPGKHPPRPVSRSTGPVPGTLMRRPTAHSLTHPPPPSATYAKAYTTHASRAIARPACRASRTVICHMRSVARPVNAGLATAGMPHGHFATAISARPPSSPMVARRPPPGGCLQVVRAAGQPDWLPMATAAQPRPTTKGSVMPGTTAHPALSGIIEPACGIT